MRVLILDPINFYVSTHGVDTGINLYYICVFMHFWLIEPQLLEAFYMCF
jgi:hypothetical protein